MIDERIQRYYLLCSIRLGVRKHIVNELPDKKIDVVFTQKEIQLYFRKQEGVWVPKETIIGGDDEMPTDHPRDSLPTTRAIVIY